MHSNRWVQGIKKKKKFQVSGRERAINLGGGDGAILRQLQRMNDTEAGSRRMEPGMEPRMPQFKARVKDKQAGPEASNVQ